MVVSVCHFTNQVEIAGGGHAPILSGARGPAPPPSAGPRAPDPKTIPIPSLASDSCISIRIGGNDVPFLFHFSKRFDRPTPACYKSELCAALEFVHGCGFLNRSAHLHFIGSDKARHFRPLLKWRPVTNPVSHTLSSLSEKYRAKWCAGSS